MIVVGIIGVLATLALPRFKQFQANAKMGEARTILSHLYTLEQSYALEHNTYIVHGLLGRPITGILTAASCTPDANAQLLGFVLDPCLPDGITPRYGYTTLRGPSGIRASFTSSARSGGNGAANPVCPGNNSHFFSMTEAHELGGRIVGSPSPSVGAVCRR